MNCKIQKKEKGIPDIRCNQSCKNYEVCPFRYVKNDVQSSPVPGIVENNRILTT
jgi:hypothetical protein